MSTRPRGALAEAAQGEGNMRFMTNALLVLQLFGMPVAHAWPECVTDADCLDSIYCNGVETCVDGWCQPGISPCDDGVACTLDACVEFYDQCTHVPDHSACDDSLFCNGAEVCDTQLGCVPGDPPCDDGVACTIDECDESTDSCTGSFPNDAVCDDGVFCNGLETCDAALGCQPGEPPCSDPAEPICDDVIDQCRPCAQDSECDDGLFCNGAESCEGGQCLQGTPPCDDGVACTVDECDEAADTCSNTPEDTTCDDGLFCNGRETCDPTQGCLSGTDPCDDDNPCTDDTCLENVDYCEHVNNADPCDDGDPCTLDDVCIQGECIGSSNPQCAPAVTLVADPGDPPVESCYAPGDVITIRVEMGESLPVIAAGQFFLEFDAAVLAFIAAEPGDPPLTVEVFEDVDHVAGTIDYLVGAPAAGEGTNGPASLAVLTFEAVGECGAFVRFRPHNPATKLVDVDGVERAPVLSDLTELAIAGSTPELLCPDDITVFVERCTDSAVVEWPPVTATDPCEGDLEVTCSSAPTEGLDSGDLFPAGTTTMTCEATNACRLVGTCSFQVNVVAGDCDDGVECTSDVCVEGSCEHQPDHASCDNGQFCDGSELCDPALGCVPGGVPCSGDLCDEALDRCFDCLADTDCDDGDVCTMDTCEQGFCAHVGALYGDLDNDGVVNLFDMFCVLDGMAGTEPRCPIERLDLHPCEGDDVINLFDLFAVLGASRGVDPCCSGTP